MDSAIKRAFDIVVSLLVLTISTPIMVLLVFVVRFSLGAPVLYTQSRPGRHGKLFRIYKFRSMTCQRDAQGNLLPDVQRLTRAGRVMRALSVDELPTLLNVLKGEMSLVGPRPLLVEYLPLYSARQNRRHEVKPGITGWAQVNGRNALSWEDKFEFDIWYVDNQSLWLDIRIIAMTIRNVFLREGISHPGEATMKKFSGNG